jgi:WD40 repeat protein
LLGAAVAIVLVTSGPALAAGGASTHQTGQRSHTAGASGSEAGPRARPAAEAVPATAGDTLWTRRYNGPANSDDGATSVAVSSDGSTVFVTGGGTGSTSGYDYTTLAYRASTGATRWLKSYNGPSSGYDQATALGLSPDGSRVFVTGASRGSGTKLDYATVAYDASSGARLWVKRYNGPGNGIDYATALGVSADGAIVFVTGYSRGSGSGDDYATVAYSASTGATVWTRRYNGPGDGSDMARALAVSPDASAVFVTGGSVGATSATDYTTVAYSATTGAKIWVKRYNGPGNYADLAHGVKVSPDGSTVFVTGESIGSDGGFDYATVAYDASNGAGLWAKRYSGTAQRDDYSTALGVSPDGSAVFVTGYSIGVANRFDYATVAYDASSGARLWVKRYNGPGNDTDDANALVVSPDASMVLVTGASFGATGSIDYATVAYDASSGAQLWVKRYNGAAAGDDFAYALAVRPDGSAVFVTGESTGSTGFLDFATVAYSLF